MNSKRIIRPGHEKGMILLTVLLIIMIVALFGAIAMVVTSTDVRISSDYRTSRQAFYAAEAGAHSVIAAYYSNPASLSSKLSASAMGFASAKPDAANYGDDKAFWISDITYDAATPPSWIKIESHGTVIDQASDASVIIYFKAIYRPFMNGAFGKDSVTFSGGGYFDSYDSRIAPWAFATHLPHGVVGTNSTASGAVTVGSNAAIYGDVAIGPNGTPNTVVRASGVPGVTGTITPEENLKDLTPIVDPGGGTSIAITGGTTGQNIYSGTYRASDLTLGGSNFINIMGNVTIYVTGNVSLTSKSYISIASGSSLKLVVAGSVSINSSGTSNQSQQPQNLIIYGTQTCTSMSFGGSAYLFAAVYAPNAAISYSGSSGMFGSLVGRSVSVSGQGSLHYDKALEDVTETGGELTAFRILSWKDGSF